MPHAPPIIANFDFWEDDDGSLSSLPKSQADGIDGIHNSTSQGRSSKRNFDDFSSIDEIASGPAVSRWLQENFPDLGPSVPALEDRKVDFGIANPFALDPVIVHPRMKSKPIKLIPQSEGAVSGLIKFRYHVKERAAAVRGNTHLRKEQGSNQPQDNPFLNPCPNLPKDFGRGMKLSPTDASLLKFYIVAFCSGRTLLSGSNGFLNDIVPIAASDHCVKHALLSLAATYVLDYLPSKELEKVANMHHKRAVMLLSQALNNQKTYNPGAEDAVVGALALMSQNDLVNWEIDRERSKTPEWLTGNQIAVMVLDKSDPGYRFRSPFNVQSSKARKYLGNKIAFNEILCSVAAPLPEGKKKCPYPWLLEGDEREVRRIDGLNGLAAKLLHCYAQITHLATRVMANPVSTVIPMVGRILESKLHNFQQWSDFSEGYITPEMMLEKCGLDVAGKVKSSADMTSIIAESKQRKHPAVQQILQRLIECISRMPTSGPLFTAQSPLFSIFVAGTVALSFADRKILKDWFVGVISSTRGNVPPAWRAMQMVWRWQDDVLVREEEEDDSQEMGSQLHDNAFPLRRAWWEEMVWEIEQSEGRLSLS